MAKVSIVAKGKKVRGTLLSSLIILGALSKLYYFPRNLHDLQNLNLTSLFVIGDLIVFWVILYGIWNWNKKSVYAVYIYFGFYLTIFLLLSIIEKLQGQKSIFGLPLFGIVLIFSFIWYTVLHRKINLFS
jgi:hypothetical protein